MQTLEVISVNLWSIVISLLNLTILFLILKKLLFKPVTKVVLQRQENIDGQYRDARRAKDEAEAHEKELEERLAGAKSEAAEIIRSASESAQKRGDEIVADAKDKADGIVKRAEEEAELTRKKARDGMKTEIASVAAALSEMLLEREINTEDHKKLIDSVIDNLGDNK